MLEEATKHVRQCLVAVIFTIASLALTRLEPAVERPYQLRQGPTLAWPPPDPRLLYRYT